MLAYHDLPKHTNYSIPMVLTTSPDMHSYFNRIPQLWNSLPMINLKYSIDTIKKQVDILIRI